MKISEKFFLFENLTDSEIEKITASLEKPKSFKKGEKIYSTDSFCRALCIITGGKAVAKSGNVVRKTFFEGDTFGVAALFGQNETYATDIFALSDCSVVFVPEERLREIFSMYPVCATNYITFLSEKIRFLNKKIELFSASSTAKKLYLYLCENEGEKLNVSAVSRATGIGRTSIYRDISELEKCGMIKKEKNSIKVISK